MARKRSRSYTLGLRAVRDDATREQWAKRLRAERERRGLTQQDVADAVGCTRSCISSWERGITSPRHESRKLLADALDVEPAKLFPERVRSVRRARSESAA